VVDLQARAAAKPDDPLQADLYLAGLSAETAG